MESQENDQEPTLAVSSLRSRFEQLAAGGGQSPVRPNVESTTVPTRPVLRPRASSNDNLSVDSTIQILRASASSSDLKSPVADAFDAKAAALKRPPPPPPTRNTKPGISPIPSPLKRPVPLPSTAAGPSRVGNGTAVYDSEQGSPPRDIATLRGLFNGDATSRSKSSTISKAPGPPIPPRPALVLPQSPAAERRSESPSTISDIDGDAPPAERPPIVPPRRPPSSPALTRSSTLESTASTSDSSSSLPPPPPPPPPRSTRPGLPPPPPRHRTSRSTNSASPDPQILSPTSSTSARPPLPSRRPTSANPSPSPEPVPPLPKRNIMAKPAVASPVAPNITQLDEPPPPIKRGSVLNKLPPPPTRIIAPGDKLPPPRRAEGSSEDEDASDDEAIATRPVDTLPDLSHSSRRLPTLTFRDGAPPTKLSFHASGGCVIASGPIVVTSYMQRVKVYDLNVSDAPAFEIETKHLGVKDPKVMCMEFRPSINPADRGTRVWMGMKDGSLLELDVRQRKFSGKKISAHLHPVLHIFRHGRAMVSLDDSGKALIFMPDPEHLDRDVSLDDKSPRAVRTTDKIDFVKMLDGKLWTASRSEQHHAGNGGNAVGRVVSFIRVYDIFNQANPSKTCIAREHTGQITTATILPTDPDRVYVGHEEGYISIWQLDTDDGFPEFEEVMKISTSDILCLEGVNERLWAGSRNGLISAYDVRQTPWTLTNCWKAHETYPVMKIFVDFRAIDTNQKLCVVTLGRDETVKFWDGLLGVDWVANKLVENESSFSTFQKLNTLVVSWNCNAARPDSLNDDRRNAEFLGDVFKSTSEIPDIITFGFQEVIDLESRRMAAKGMIMGKRKDRDDALSDRVTGAYKRWHDRLSSVVKATFGPLGVEYNVVNTESMVGLFTCIFVRNTSEFVCREKSVAALKRGMGGRYGNKGAVIARVVIGDSSLCFVNCHLAAGQHAVKQRNSDVAAILEEKGILDPSPLEAAYVRGGDGTMVMDHEFVLLTGDLNYRIDVHRRETYASAFHSGDLAPLLAHDQLLMQMKNNKAFRLRGFTEGPINFLPTYKYDPRSDDYDTSEKRREPAWCDRILWQSRVQDRVKQLDYRRWEVNVSDHRPVSATFVITAKKVDTVARQQNKAIVEAAWADEHVRLLASCRKFYVRQALL